MEPEKLFLIGLLLIFLGTLLIFISALLSGKGEGKFAVIGFLGPIPFGFGNDKNFVMMLLIFAIILVLVISVLFRSF